MKHQQDKEEWYLVMLNKQRMPKNKIKILGNNLYRERGGRLISKSAFEFNHV